MTQKRTPINVTYTGVDGNPEIVNFVQEAPNEREVEIELEPKPEPKVTAVEDGAYEVSTEDLEEKPEPRKEVKSDVPKEDSDMEYKDRTKRRIDQLLAKQQEAQRREQYLLAEMEKLKSNLSEMSQVKSDYEVSAITERKAALSVAQKALSAQAAEALSSGDYGEFQKIDNDLKRIMIDLHQIEQAENKLQTQKERSLPPKTSSYESSYEKVPEASYEAPQKRGSFMDSLSAGDESPRHVMQLQEEFEAIYDSLPPHEQRWVDERSHLFDMTTAEGQRRMASVLGTAAYLQRTLGGDHPDYLRELDQRLIRKNLLKPDSLESSSKKPSRSQPVMTEPSARAPKKQNTVKLNSYEVEAARSLIGSRGITTEEEALKAYVKNKLKFEQSIENLS